MGILSLISRVVVSGEGVTDIGIATNGEHIAHEENFQPGPMYKLIEKLLSQHLPDWHQGLETTTSFVYRKGLGELVRGKDVPTRFPSKNKAVQGHVEHTKRAFALSLVANDLTGEGENTLAVYFHDTDGTRSELAREPKRQENRVEAIKLGFNTAGFSTGVAMVPKPTSESWLYCSCKDSPYITCQQLETSLSGNQKSDRHPKVKLAEACEPEVVNFDKLNVIVDEIDLSRLNMESFNVFRNDIKAVIRVTCGTVED